MALLLTSTNEFKRHESSSRPTKSITTRSAAEVGAIAWVAVDELVLRAGGRRESIANETLDTLVGPFRAWRLSSLPPRRMPLVFGPPDTIIPTL